MQHLLVIFIVVQTESNAIDDSEPSSSSDSVKIVFGISYELAILLGLRDVEVNNHLNVWHIQTSSKQIGSE